MRNKKQIHSNLMNDFIDSRGKLSKEDQIFESGKLIREIEKIETDEAFLKVQQRISKKDVFCKAYANFSRYAAILLLPLLSLFILTLSKNKQNIPSEELTMQEISCPVGMRSQVRLPDGTQVWLNAGSTIKYSLPFVQKTRNVELLGEAFLDVAKNEKAPFTIQAGNVKVNVVGTQFNFKAYDNDNTIQVSLKEGAINLSLESEDNELSTIKMLPNDHFVFNKVSHKANVKNQNIDIFLSWRDNKLVLNETPIQEMEKLLERWYGVDINIADKSIENYKFTTTFENLPLDQALKLLELSSPIEIKLIPPKTDKQTLVRTKSKIIISKRN